MAVSLRLAGLLYGFIRRKSLGGCEESLLQHHQRHQKLGGKNKGFHCYHAKLFSTKCQLLLMVNRLPQIVPLGFPSSKCQQECENDRQGPLPKYQQPLLKRAELLAILAGGCFPFHHPFSKRFCLLSTAFGEYMRLWFCVSKCCLGPYLREIKWCVLSLQKNVEIVRWCVSQHFTWPAHLSMKSNFWMDKVNPLGNIPLSPAVAFARPSNQVSKKRSQSNEYQKCSHWRTKITLFCLGAQANKVRVSIGFSSAYCFDMLHQTSWSKRLIPFSNATQSCPQLNIPLHCGKCIIYKSLKNTSVYPKCRIWHRQILPVAASLASYCLR